MRMFCIAFVTLGLAAPVRADSKPEYRVSFNMPATFGATFGGRATAGAVALRPELLFLRTREGLFDHTTRTLGIGCYGEVRRLAGANERGGGVTLAFGSGKFGVAPSIGLLQRGDERAVEGSVFVGMLDVDEFDHYHLATGVRIDVRRLGAETQTTVSYQLDLALPVLGVALMSSLARR